MTTSSNLELVVIFDLIAIVGPMSRFNKEKIKNYTRILQNAALFASEQLGYEGE